MWWGEGGELNGGAGPFTFFLDAERLLANQAFTALESLCVRRKSEHGLR